MTVLTQRSPSAQPAARNRVDLRTDDEEGARMSDVWLESDAVVVSGAVLRCEAADLNLDDSERRSDRNRNVPRRAVVHDPKDGLTLNWNGDYPGGITLFGPVRAIGGRALRSQTTDFELDHEDRRSDVNADRPRRALVHDYRDRLTLNWDGDYPSGVMIQGPVTVQGEFSVRDRRGRETDVVQRIRELESTVEALTRRLAALEGRA